MDTQIRKRIHYEPVDDIELEEKSSEPPTKCARVGADKTREDLPKNEPAGTCEHTRPARGRPVQVSFNLSEQTESVAEDANIELTRKKQLRLLTIHEQLGHLSFPVLKLLARCGLISRDLQHVTPPMCPGCAYGKAHRKQWRHKGQKGVKHL